MWSCGHGSDTGAITMIEQPRKVVWSMLKLALPFFQPGPDPAVKRCSSEVLVSSGAAR